jgi:cytochrome P450
MCSSIDVSLEILEELNGRDFDALSLYQGLTCQVISECALAMKVNCQRDPNDEFMKAISGFLKNAMSPLVFVALSFPFVGWIITKVVERLAISGQMTKMICENVERVIRIRREEKWNNLVTNAEDGNHVDVLQLMLDATERGVKEKRLTDDEIVANAWVFVLGGFETTASALTFTTYLLMRHPDIQQRLFNELASAFAIDEIPSYEKVNSLTYLDQIICESLRLYPPVVAFVIRENEKPIQLGPYVIPPKVNLQIPVWEIHHDPNLWPDPFCFDPERFSPANKKTHASMSWIPFGGGPRNCVGMRFALLETKFALARIFRTFKFLPSEFTEDTLNLTVATVTITPQNGVHLRCERRTE